MQTTTNYGLKKPEYSDTADIKDINDNMDTIDTNLKTISDMADVIDDRFTSGKLKVANGGTGLSSNPSMKVNLATTDADDVLKSSPRPGVTGTLPIANGGTGATSASGARTSLGLGVAATRAVANNLTTTESGSVLDARQGKALNDKITRINMTFGSTTKTSSANGNIDLDMAAARYKVVSAWCSDVGSVVCIPYIGSTAGNWWVHCTTDGANMPVKTNTRMTINFYYMTI